jgi:hypothetical protein
MSIIYDIADEYLPDKNVYGIDSPDVLLAEEIVCKVLDAAVEAVDSCKSTVYIDGKLKYVVIPLSQAKARLNKLRDR